MQEYFENSNSPIRIVSLDGSDIYRRMHKKDGGGSLSVKDEKGKLDTGRFRGFLDSSLDTDQMKRIYASHSELAGKFIELKKFTKAVVNVTFDYSVKQYYNKSKYFYVKDGYEISWYDLKDHVCVSEEDGKPVLAAIEVAKSGKKDDSKYVPVEEPVEESILGDFFYYDAEKRQYFVRHKKDSKGKDKSETLISMLQNKREIRKWLYQNGFDIDGVHYVRYKRSAGSSRDGHCLFIAEPLYEDMMKWSSCGLDPENVKDQASWQAYISLTLSSIEKKIHIPRQSILLIKDQVSVFEDDVIRVTSDNSDLVAKKERTRIENIVWDGEALLDKSVFDENGYSDKGMMLLRNRFFKTCAFNTNLQEWFADNNITRLSQLNGYYSSSARSIKDIKLVITESSLKYLKFKPKDVEIAEWFEKWLDNVYVSKEQSLFGVVKTDKPSGPMQNTLVKTNYQLLNTLALSEDDTKELLEPSLDFLHKMQTDPMFLRYYTNPNMLEVSSGKITTENYRPRLICDLMRLTDDFEGTVFYKNYRSEICRNFKNDLKSGRILIGGGNHTLLGNGPEFLRAVIDKSYTVDEPLYLRDGEIFTQKFADGEELLCQRSPHITMGNLLVVKNKRVGEIEKYFNLGAAKAIVCVNAIRSNLQQRLNGCDYDSDFMLITNHPTLLRAASGMYDKFFVPFCDVLPGGKQSYSTSPEDLAELDVQISENKIGEIVNLSQFLNSLYWDKLAHNASEEELEPLYCDICKLAVLSGMEIDKAKRLYPVSAAGILGDLRRYKDEYKRKNDNKIPEFFARITEVESKDASSKNARLDTAMSFVYDCVKSDKVRASGIKSVRYTELFDIYYQKGDPTGAFGKRRDSILDYVSEAYKTIKRLNFTSRKKNLDDKLLAREQANELFENCKQRVSKNIEDHVLCLLLKELDDGEESKKAVSACNALLFASMVYAEDGYLLSKLKKPLNEMYDLIFVSGDDIPNDESEELIYVYGHPHLMKKSR